MSDIARQQTALTELAKLGFTELGEAGALVDGVPDHVIPLFAHAADADQALRLLGELREHAAAQLGQVLAVPGAADRLVRILGASRGIAEFFLRHPEELSVLLSPMDALPDVDTLREDLVASVAGLVDDAAFTALRVRYRRHLAAVAGWDL